MRTRNNLCLMMWLALPAMLLAQGSLDEYQRANSVREWARGGVYRDSLHLQWLNEGRHAWYRIETTPGVFEFVFINAESGTRTPVFDHFRLAEALSEVSGQPVEADRLPFRQITFSDDLSSTRFAAFDTAWSLDLESQEINKIDVDAIAESNESLPVYARRRRSIESTDETYVEFINRLDQPVNLDWIDGTGNTQRYATLAPGAERMQHTYAGHSWLLTTEGGEQVAVYVAVNEISRAIIDGREADSVGQRDESDDAPTRRRSGRVSPDGEFEIFIREYNVWARELETGKEFVLSTTGTEDNAFTEIFHWSPDSQSLVVLQTTSGESREVFIVDSAPDDQLQPELIRYNYNKPGDVLPVSRPRLFSLVDRQQVDVSDALFPNAWSIDHVHWWPDSSAFTFLYNQRGHQVMRIVEVEAQSGEASAIIDEQCDTFFDYAYKEYTRYIDEAREIIWMSERDGWNHLYLYDGQNDELHSITQGEWVVRGVERIDDEQRQIWFRAGGIHPEQDPYYIHLCRVNFDGSGLTILTEGNGTHEWEFSPDGEFLIDRYSRVDMPPVTELRRADDGSFVCTLETADWSQLLETGWRPPERFVAPGRDGVTPIYGIIARPTNFDPNRQYPVIEKIYAGPQGAFVPKEFSPQYETQALAELGFIVVQIDGMGTSHRSKAFHDVCWQNLGDAGFPDRILWMQAAAEVHPEMDLSRVGIYGGSAGGQNALRGMLMYPDFYKVGAADCGCHDNRMDKVWWNELWMGWPVGPHYEEQSNVTQAHRLEGHLLLIVGELDTNVDPASTMQVVDALVQADKDFDFLIIPGAGHGAAGTPYARRRQWDFFVRHLHGVEPRWEMGVEP